MSPTIPEIIYNIRRNATEIAHSRDATEDIADAAAAIIEEATELLEAIPTTEEWKQAYEGH